MGTNYYLHRNICEHCNRPEDKLHIGKSSIGWQFTFHGILRAEYEDADALEIKSWKDWRQLLLKPGNKIVDEYGRLHDYMDFKEMVLTKQKTSSHHSTVTNDAVKQWYDSEGYRFMAGEFC